MAKRIKVTWAWPSPRKIFLLLKRMRKVLVAYKSDEENKLFFKKNAEDLEGSTLQSEDATSSIHRHGKFPPPSPTW